MYKLFEKVIHENISNDVHFKHPEFPSKQKQGYQKQMGSSTVAFNIHESIYNTVETGEKAFVAFSTSVKRSTLHGIVGFFAN